MDTLYTPDAEAFRAPGPGELWKDGRNLSYIGITGISERHDVVLAYRILSLEANHNKWERGEAEILSLADFKQGWYTFVCLAI